MRTNDKTTTTTNAFISFNRFLKTQKPYFIILENPYALVNYADRRPKHKITKIKLDKLFNDKNLKGIICVSDACKKSLTRVYSIPKTLKIIRIYPLIKDEPFKKDYSGPVNCLFITSNFYLKGGAEIIASFSRIRKEYNSNKIKLTIITPLKNLDIIAKTKIKSLDIKLVDYNLSKQELDTCYSAAHILLNPTRMDSYSLVTLESIKFGCTYIGTNLYAIPEMIEDQKNGFITNSKFSPWKDDYTFDHARHMQIDKLSHKGPLDPSLVDFLVEKITFLANHIDILKSMNAASYHKANNGDFSESKIYHQWEKLLKTGRL